MGAKRSLLARHSQVRSACPLAGRLCGAIALCEAICLPWVRARGAHGKTACARANGMAFGDPMAGGLRGAGEADGHVKWPAIALCANRFAVRALCAHPRHAIGLAIG